MEPRRLKPDRRALGGSALLLLIAGSLLRRFYPHVPKKRMLCQTGCSSLGGYLGHFGATLSLKYLINKVNVGLGYSLFIAIFCSLHTLIFYFPTLAPWGIGRLLAGVTNGGILVFMERRLLHNVPVSLWSSYFAIYIVICHISGLLSQVLLNTSLLCQRHTVVSMMAFLVFFILFPRSLLIAPVHDKRRISIKLNTHARGLSHPWFKNFLSFMIGLMLSGLSIAFPLYWLTQSCPTLPILPMVLCVLVVSTLAQVALDQMLANINAVTLLRLQLLLIVAGTLGMICAAQLLWLFIISLSALNFACQTLYPVLIRHAYRLGEQRTPTQLTHHFKQYLDIGNSFSSILNMACISSSLSLISMHFFQQDRVIFYLIHGYALLFFCALKSGKENA